MRIDRLSERIGNIDDRLVLQAEHIPDYGKRHRVKIFGRLAAGAAILVLMAGSFVLGMTAEAGRRVKPNPVGIGIIDFGEELGLSVLLPDGWGGDAWEDWTENFGTESNQDGSYNVYSKKIREACMASDDDDFIWGGVLFSIARLPGQLTQEQIQEEGRTCEYIAATDSGTYVLIRPENVQYTPETEELYQRLESEIKDIQYVISDMATDALSMKGTEDQFEGTIAGIVKGVTENSITVDIVEYVDETDTERLKELGVSEEDMWDGFYIHNPNEELMTWTYSDEVTFTFVDWAGEFTGYPYPAYYTTSGPEEFRRYAEPYTEGWLLLFFKVEDGVVQYVLERPIM